MLSGQMLAGRCMLMWLYHGQSVDYKKRATPYSGYSVFQSNDQLPTVRFPAAD